MTLTKKGNTVTIVFEALPEGDAPLSSTGKMKLGYASGWQGTADGSKINICYGYPNKVKA